MTGRQPNAIDASRRRSAVSSSHQNARTEGDPPRKSHPKRFGSKLARAMKYCQAGFAAHSLTPQLASQIIFNYQCFTSDDLLTPANYRSSA